MAPASAESSSGKIRRIAIVFSGGPAPGANAVISAAAIAFLQTGLEVVGILHGYSKLISFSPDKPLVEDADYMTFSRDKLRRGRNRPGVMIGTARANPGKSIKSPADLKDATKSAPLKCVYEGLVSLGVDALVSIGGDDTLKTANKFQRYQDHLPAGSKRIKVVHLPKTIDNDYLGIDFTFGYFTAVETLASEMRNLLYDAEASRAYFMCETMGRSAGWLAYGAAIAGDASLVLSIEDITGRYLTEEDVTDAEGKKVKRKVMNVEEVAKRIVRTMRFREEEEKKQYGVIVIAEGIGELLPYAYVKDVERDDFGHIAISKLHLGKVLAKVCADEYTKQTGKSRKITGLQLGYESRCAPPHAFDVMLGSQLGVGAYRALVEKGLDGVMVSITGQLDLRYVPFVELVDPQTLVTVVRYIPQGSDFHQLARFLEAGAQEP